MNDAEDFAEYVEDKSGVYEAKVLGKVVFVAYRNDFEPPYTFGESMDVGWVLIYYEPNESGDIHAYAPLEWFNDD